MEQPIDQLQEVYIPSSALPVPTVEEQIKLKRADIEKNLA